MRKKELMNVYPDTDASITLMVDIRETGERIATMNVYPDTEILVDDIRIYPDTVAVVNWQSMIHGEQLISNPDGSITLMVDIKETGERLPTTLDKWTVRDIAYAWNQWALAQYQREQALQEFTREYIPTEHVAIRRAVRDRNRAFTMEVDD